MCDEAYEEAIENASDMLADAMLDREFEGLIEEGRQLDAKADDLLTAVGRRLMGRLYEMLGSSLEQEAKAEGMTVERRPTVTFHVLFGPIEVASPYLYDRQSGRSSRPLKEHFGVRGDSCSDAVERAMTEFGKEASFQQASLRFEEHYGWSVGRTTMMRRTEQAAEAAEEFVDERIEAFADEHQKPDIDRDRLADEIFVQADGCMIRTGQLMSAKEAAGKTDDLDEQNRFEQMDEDTVVRLENWREVRTGLARRPGQVEPTYVCRRGEWPEVIEQLFGVASKLGLHFETQVVATGDGGHGLKEAIEEWFARLQYILDRPHLKEHLVEMAEKLDLDGLDEIETWVSTQLDAIHEGRVSEVIAELTSMLADMEGSGGEGQEEETASERLDRLIDYLTRFSDCVHYDQYRDNDWPIGSGEVESAHRHIPQQRLKIAGACWREENLNPMLSLRVIAANDWWDDFWQWENQRRAA